MDELSVVLKARELINKVGPSTIPVAIKPYVEQVDAVLHVDHGLAADEAGYAFEKNGKHHICINGKDSEERQRFTACHEVAHIALGLPSDHKELPWWSYAKRSPNEIFCDVFAAELLLPYKLFKPLVDKTDISLAAVDHLACRFVASNMATGSRFATLASAPCAFVLSERGKVRYASRSTLLRRANAWIPPRTILPQGSLSERLRNGGASSGPEEVDAEIWFSNWELGGTMIEDARHLAQWDQTVALLWFEDEEVPAPNRDRAEREEEEFGLTELDGVLPWPGKRAAQIAMAAATLLSLFPKPEDVLALTPEDFGGVIIETRGLLQPISDELSQLHRGTSLNKSYPRNQRRVGCALVRGREHATYMQPVTTARAARQRKYLQLRENLLASRVNPLP